MGGWLGGSLSFLKQRKHSSLPRRPCLSWADTACPGAPAGPLLLREGRPGNAPCHLGSERDEIEKRVKTPRLPALGGAQGADRTLWNHLFLLSSCPIAVILAEAAPGPGTASPASQEIPSQDQLGNVQRPDSFRCERQCLCPAWVSPWLFVTSVRGGGTEGCGGSRDAGLPMLKPGKAQVNWDSWSS